MVIISYTTNAYIDLKNIFLYISNDSFLNAKRFTKELKNHIKTLKAFPEKGRQIMPEYYPTLRQVLYKTYKIIYTFKTIKSLFM